MNYFYMLCHYNIRIVFPAGCCVIVDYRDYETSYCSGGALVHKAGEEQRLKTF